MNFNNKSNDEKELERARETISELKKEIKKLKDEQEETIMAKVCYKYNHPDAMGEAITDFDAICNLLEEEIWDKTGFSFKVELEEDDM